MLYANQPSPVLNACGFAVWASPHDAEPVAERVEVDDPVVPHPGFLLLSREVQVLGGEPQQPGVLVDCLLPQGGPAVTCLPVLGILKLRGGWLSSRT